MIVGISYWLKRRPNQPVFWIEGKWKKHENFKSFQELSGVFSIKWQVFECYNNLWCVSFEIYSSIYDASSDFLNNIDRGPFKFKVREQYHYMSWALNSWNCQLAWYSSVILFDIIILCRLGISLVSLENQRIVKTFLSFSLLSQLETGRNIVKRIFDVPLSGENSHMLFCLRSIYHLPLLRPRMNLSSSYNESLMPCKMPIEQCINHKWRG